MAKPTRPPEQMGRGRGQDYGFSWLRDSALVLYTRSRWSA